MITIDKENGIFHLHNAQVSYVLQVVRDRYVLHRVIRHNRLFPCCNKYVEVKQWS